LRESETYAFEKEILAEADGKRFADQLKAYRAAPEIYSHEQRMVMLEQALKDIRKYVVVADQNDTQITIIDLHEDPLSLYSTFEESSEQ
jgi:ethanolamine ammonia-lyase large subunit